MLKFRVGKSNIFVVALKFLRWCFSYSDGVFAASCVEDLSGVVHNHLNQWICERERERESFKRRKKESSIPSSEKERKEGMRKERVDCEWFTLRHLRENHPSSAWGGGGGGGGERLPPKLMISPLSLCGYCI